MKTLTSTHSFWFLLFGALVTTVALGQSRLVYRTEDQTWPVAGLVSGVLVREEGGKYFPLENYGQLALESTDVVEFVAGEAEVDYRITREPITEGSVVENVTVNVTTRLRIWEDVEGLYYVRAWMDDDDMVQVSTRKLPFMKRSSIWPLYDSFTLRREREGGHVWVGIFRDATPVVMTKGKPSKGPQLQLSDALMTGNEAAVQRALDSGARWARVSDEQASRLAMDGHLDWLRAWAAESRKWQIKQGPDLLWYAVRATRTDVIAWLLEAGVDPLQQTRVDQDLLTAALETRRPDIVAQLLRSETGTWSSRVSRNNPLIIAAAYGDTEIVQKLKDAGMTWPHDPDDYKRPLVFALRQRSAEGVRLLMESGAIDPRDPKRDELLSFGLNSASGIGDPDLLRPLLALGVPWDRFSRLGYQPIARAILGGKIEALNLLVESGADASELPGQRDWDPITLALQQNQIAMVRRLEELGAKPTTLSKHRQQIWEESLIMNATDVGNWLVEHRVSLGVKPDEIRGLVKRALNQNYTPLLRAAMQEGWTAASDMGDGWDVAGVATWLGLTEPVELLNDQTGGVSPENFASAKGLRVVDRVAPAYPRELADRTKPGEAAIQVLVNPEGRVEYARVAEATAPEFGRAAQKALLRWIFSPLPKGESGWRRVKVPVEFTPLQEAEGFVAYRDLSRRPVPVTLASVDVPVGQSEDTQGLAQVSVMIDAEGNVMQARVVLITDEAWRESVEASVRRWKFQPAIKDEKPVITAASFYVFMPVRGVLPEDGLPVGGRERLGANETIAVLKSYSWIDVTAEEAPNGGIALLEIVVKKNGRVETVKVLAANPANLSEKFISEAKRWRFRAATRDGEAIDQTVFMPITFRAWSR